MSKPRITIDASSLLLRSAGIKTYTYHWIEALRALSSQDHVRAFPFIGRLRTLDHEHSMYSKLETYPRLAWLLSTRFLDGAALQPALWGSDIFHASNQVRHAPRGVKLTASIHDMTCWLMPELHTAANVKADQYFADRIWKRADALIAVSENTRQDAIKLVGLREDRVHTVHSGVSERFFQVTPDQAATARQQLQLNKPFALCLGTVEPRKNIDRLLDAWSQLPPDVREEYELIVAGPMGWAADHTVARLRSGMRGVRHIGYVPEHLLAGLTAAACLFVYPSLYEGFGFPVAQAMAAGVAVLTSNVSSLPEVAGPGAALIDPLSVEDLRATLLRLLCSGTERAHLAQAGRAFAQRYRWTACAERSWRIFEQIA